MVSRDGPVMTTSQRTALIRRVIDEAIGLGVLEPLLADESVTEIMVNGPDRCSSSATAGSSARGCDSPTRAQLLQTIDRIVSQVNRRVDESSPMVDARLPTGERVNVIIPPLSLIGARDHDPPLPAAVHARRVGRGRLAGRADAAAAVGVVRARLNVVISGGTGTGKTTLLNALRRSSSSASASSRSRTRRSCSSSSRT